jgi:hypothetical protein
MGKTPSDKEEKSAHTRKIKKNRSERGNIFFTLFGAVTIVGLLGTGIMSTMKGPLSTMVEINRIEEAKAEMRVNVRLILTQPQEYDTDSLQEPIDPSNCSVDVTGAGCIPSSLGAKISDPWGNDYAYCAWNLGADFAGNPDPSNNNLLEGDVNANYYTIALISAGPDLEFESDCGAAPPSVSEAGDDIIVPMTYEQALASSGGLWTLDPLDPNELETERNIEVGGSGTFGGNVDLTVGSGQLRLGAASMILPTQAELVTCNGANENLLRINTAANPNIIQLCDSSGDWVLAGSIWNINLATGDITYDGGEVNIGDALNVTGAAALDGGATTTTLNATGAVDLDNTLNVDGSTTLVGTLDVDGNTTVDALNAAEAVDFDSTLNVDGATTLGSTLGVTGATTLSDTLGVTGAATLSSTLDVTGDTAITGALDVDGNTTVDTLNAAEAVDFDSTLNVDGATDIAGTLTVDDNIVTTGTGTITSAGGIFINGTEDLDPTECNTSERIFWDGNSWDCETAIPGGSGDGGAMVLDDLGDVNTGGGNSYYDCLVYNDGSGTWVKDRCIPEDIEGIDSITFNNKAGNPTDIRITLPGLYGGTQTITTTTAGMGEAGSNIAILGGSSGLTGGSVILDGGVGTGADGNVIIASNNGAVGVGTSTISGDLLMDVAGKVGAVSYCDADGNNCFVATDINAATIFEVTGAAGSELVRQVAVNVPYATSDFLFGSSQLNDTGNADHDNRMFFDKSSGAFRAGGAQSTQWDSRGSYSFAIGLNSTAGFVNAIAMGASATASSHSAVAIGEGAAASGSRSFAAGNSANAGGDRAVALGRSAAASGEHSTALGYSTTASGSISVSIGNLNIASNTNTTAIGYDNDATGLFAMTFGDRTTASGNNSLALGQEVKATGINTLAIGLADQNNDNALRPIVSGMGSMGIFMDQADSYDMTLTDTLGVIGGQIMIDTDAVGTDKGCIRYNDTDDELEYSDDCTTYIAFSNIAGSGNKIIDADGDTQIQVEEGADDDTIRFDTAGYERLTIAKSGNINYFDNDGDKRLQIYSNATQTYIGGGNNGAGSSQLRIRAENSSPLLLGAHNGEIRLQPGPYDGANSYEFGPGYTETFVREDGASLKASEINLGAIYDAANNLAFVRFRPAKNGTIQTGLTVAAQNASSLAFTGIGTEAPATLLHVEGGEVMIDADSDATSRGCIRYNDTDDELEFSDDCTTYLSIAEAAAAQSLWKNDGPEGPAEIYYNAGNVGIGTNDPSSLLHIASAAPSLELSTSTANVGSTSLLFTHDINRKKVAIYSDPVGAWGKGDIKFAINNASDNTPVSAADAKLTITSTGLVGTAGNFGAGTTNPGDIIEAYTAGDAIVRINSGNNAGNSILRFSHTGAGDAANQKTAIIAPSSGPWGRSTGLFFAINNVSDATNVSLADSKLAILASGNVGIGTTDPTQDGDQPLKLDVAGAVGATHYCDDAGLNCFTPDEVDAASVFEVTGGAGTEVVRQVPANAPLATSDFVFGSTQLGDTGNADHYKRMFFDKSKGAFRAGYVDAAQWDNPQVGEYSFAGTRGSIASGYAAVSLARSSTASGSDSAVIGGEYNTASGIKSIVAGGRYNDSTGEYATTLGGIYLTALGNYSIAMGQDVRTTGTNTFAIGLADQAASGLNRPQVSGEGSLGIFMDSADNYNLTTTDTLAIIGGELMIDTDAVGTDKGCIRYNDTDDELEYSDDCTTYTSFADLGSLWQNDGPGGPAEIYYNGGNVGIGTTDPTQDGDQPLKLDVAGAVGATYYCDDAGLNCFTPDEVDAASVFEVTGAAGSEVVRQVAANAPLATSDFLFGSTQLNDTGNADHDRRMFFDKSKGAFRAGYVDAAQWDNPQVGEFSFAGSRDSTASGYAAVSLARSSTASGSDSAVIGGEYNTASGIKSIVAGGRDNTSSGEYAATLGGIYLAALGNYSIAMGQDVRTTGTNTFAIGLADQAASGLNRPQVSGEGSLGIFMDSADNYNLAATDTFAIIGGELMIDTDAVGTDKGCIRYNDTDDELEFSDDCSTYATIADIATGSSLWKNDGPEGPAEIYYNGGNVGIGTNDPAYPLEVTGVAKASRLIASSATVNPQTNLGTPANYQLTLTNENVDVNEYAGIAFSGSSASTEAQAAIVMLPVTARRGNLAFFTKSSTGSGHAPLERMRITAAGNVGIGHTSPPQRLSVSGELGIYGLFTNSTNYERLTSKYDSVNSEYYIGTEKGSSGGTARPLTFGTDSLRHMTIDTSGNVGIGTTDPTQDGDQPLKLDVAGAVGATHYCDDAGLNCSTPAALAALSGGIFEVTGGAGTELVRQVAANAPLATSDFLFGSTQLDDTGNADHDNRMFFDKSKGAFRAGKVTGDEWDSAKVGEASFASGWYTTASGPRTVAMGHTSTASGDSAIAIGRNATASGEQSVALSRGSATGANSFAVGIDSSAGGSGAIGLGKDITAQGNYSIGLGQELRVNGTSSVGFGLHTASQATNPNVAGNRSVAFFMDGGVVDKTSGYVMSETDTLAVIGGKIMIDGDAIGTDKGCIRYNDTDDVLEFSDDCSTYASIADIAAGSGLWKNDGAEGPAEIYYNGGNVGIGTNDPGQKLEVKDSTNPQLRLTHTDNTAYTDLQTTTDGNLVISPSNNQINISNANLYGDDDWIIYANGQRKIRFYGSGFFGPSDNIQIRSNAIQINDTDPLIWGRFGWSTQRTYLYQFGGAMTPEAGHLGLFSATGDAKFSVYSDASNVNSAPTNYERVSITSTTGGNATIATEAGGTGTAGDLILNPSTGNVGIGTTDPTQNGDQPLKLDVAGAVGATHYCDDAGLNCFIASDVSGGVFEVTGGAGTEVVRQVAANAPLATADFLFGAAQFTNTVNRMFFDKSKGAFRVGTTTAGQWGDAHIGQNSVAMGRNTRAGGAQSAALGNHTVAIGEHSTALGNATTSSGINSIAFGREVTAGSGTAEDGTGDYAIAVGLQSVAQTTDPKITGDRSMVLFFDGNVANANSTYDFTDNDKFAIIGGEFQIGETQAQGAEKGCIRYNDTDDVLEYSDNCSTYAAFSDIGSLWSNDGPEGPAEIYYNGGNVGIGTNNPDNPLEIFNATSTSFNALKLTNLYTNAGGANSVGIQFALRRDNGDKLTTAQIDAVAENTTWPNTGLSFKVGANSISEKMRLYSNGNLDINGSKLNLGTGAHKFTIDVNNTSDIHFQTNYGTPYRFSINGSERMRITNGGNVGIGTNNPAYNLEVNGSLRATSLVMPAGQTWNGSYSGSVLNGRTWTDGDTWKYGSSVNLGWTAGVNPSGEAIDTGLIRSGIGVLSQVAATTPQEYRIYNTDNGANDEFASLGWINNSNVFGIQTEATGTGTLRNMALLGGNVGVGTSTISSNIKMHVVGRSLITEGVMPTGGNYSWGFAYHTGGPAVYGGAYASGVNRYIRLAGSPGVKMHIRNSTNVDFATFDADAESLGLGTTAPDSKLHVVGDIRMTGVLIDLSDERLKTDIRNLQTLSQDTVLARLDQISGYAFKMKEGDGKTEYGILAQEIEKVFPELVFTAEDEMGTKSVNYTGLIAPLIEATKELKAQNVEKDERLAALETRMAELENTMKGVQTHTGYNTSKGTWGILALMLMLMSGGMGGIYIMRRHMHTK